MKTKTYKDIIHGYTAIATSRTMAWQLIRGKCREEKKEVPTIDKIIEQ